MKIIKKLVYRALPLMLLGYAGITLGDEDIYNNEVLGEGGGFKQLSVRTGTVNNTTINNGGTLIALGVNDHVTVNGVSINNGGRFNAYLNASVTDVIINEGGSVVASGRSVADFSWTNTTVHDGGFF